MFIYVCHPNPPLSSLAPSLISITHLHYYEKKNLIAYMFQAYDDELNMKGHNFEISHN